MRAWLLTLLTMSAALGGCLSDDGPGDDPDDASDLPAPLIYSGSVAFGESTLEGTGASVPSGFGLPNFTYVAGYAPEPNIGITSSGAVFMSAFSTVMRSEDHGDTWEAVQQHHIPVVGDLVGDNNDPMLWVDPWTDRVYNAPMFPILLCASIYWSDDDGDSWTDTPSPGCGTGTFDHQKLASGPAGVDVNPFVAAGLHPTVLYLCYNGVVVTNCAVSYDGGQTWPVDRPTILNTVGTAAGAAGIDLPTAVSSGCFSGQNGHPTVSQQGVVAFLRTWSCAQPVLTYSTDSGLTWTNVPGPQFPGGPSDFLTTANAHSIDPEVAFTPDGTMYVLFQSHDHHAYLARTSDLGASWEGPWDVTPPGVGSTVFGALATGDDGRIAMAFVGARNVTGSSAAVDQDTRWHLWMVTSEDAASDDPTFVAYQATPEDDPVQVGQIHQGGAVPGENDRNLLDFIDGAVAPDGTFYVAYADGCTPGNGCSGIPYDEQTSAFRATAGVVASLRGWSLLAEPRDGPLPL